TAVVDGDRVITYGELSAFASTISAELAHRGVRSGDRVAVLVPKSIEAVAAFLGCLSIDAPYVPVDLSSPAARVARMMTVAEPAAVVALGTGEELLAAIRDVVRSEATADRSVWEPRVITIDPWEESNGSPASSLPVPDTPGLAHVLFTSGSTGLPKGVAVEVANVSHFVDWAIDYFGITAGDRLSGHAPFHFDLSTFDIYGALGAGAELHLVPPAMNLLPHKLADWIRESGLTQWFSVPTVFAQLVQAGVVAPGDFPELRQMLWCGEAVNTAVLRELMGLLPDVTFTNLYGPTETTIASSVHRMPARPGGDLEPVPIGQSIPGEVLSIRDGDGAELPVGEKGEICIGGLGMTRGYWRDEERTTAAFGDRTFYRTGDVGFEDENGLFHVLGRLDNQIKFRGHRIELGEIETALHALPGVRQAAVVFPDLARPAIAAAVVLDQGMETAAVRAAVGELVPPYMVPARWESVDELPTNANGKVDRVAVRTWFEEEGTPWPTSR
ncbi:MAG: amino acid adenylation domain-containing protein, partial [Actinomycetota bacterium]